MESLSRVDSCGSAPRTLAACSSSTLSASPGVNVNILREDKEVDECRGQMEKLDNVWSLGRPVYKRGAFELLVQGGFWVGRLGQGGFKIRSGKGSCNPEKAGPSERQGVSGWSYYTDGKGWEEGGIEVLEHW